MASLEELFTQLQALVAPADGDPNHVAALPVIEKSNLACSRPPRARRAREMRCAQCAHPPLRMRDLPPQRCRAAALTHARYNAAVLALAPDDADALRCKLVALINMKRFAEALDVCEKKPSIAKVCAFEKAYANYRLNRHEEALETIEAARVGGGQTWSTVRMDLLRAQVLYRLGRYHESGEVYGNLEDEETDPGELAVNRSAAMSEAGEAEEAENVLKGTAAMLGETADMAYNRACAVIARGDMTRALLVLDQAEQLHRQVSLPPSPSLPPSLSPFLGAMVAYARATYGRQGEGVREGCTPP
jgi:signal recognition particle subunit SRP72